MSLPDPNLLDYDFTGGQQYFFDRKWSVEIGAPGQPGKVYQSGQMNSEVVGSVLNGIRVEFDLTKTSQSSSNKGKVSLTNLSDDSRNQYLKGGQLTLAAGYSGLIETLYIGQFLRTKNHRKGATIITEFEIGDAEEELYNNFINKSYPPGTNIVQVFQDLLSELGLPLGVISGIQASVFNKGFVACGGIKDILDRELKKQGLEWSVHNGVVQVIPVGSHNGDSAIVVNQETGLVGIPTGPMAGDNVVSFTSLLNPKLFPGVPVLLQSTNTEVGPLQGQYFTGLYKVRTAHFEGDTHGEKWQVTCECEPLTDFIAATNQNLAGAISAASVA